jgi:hypothetical protein
MTPEELTEIQKKAYNQTVINDNKIISEQEEHSVYSSKVYWQKPFICCEPGCQEKTCLTRRINLSVVAKMLGKEPEDFFQPLCERHFRETHAIGMLEIAENEKQLQR